MNTKDSTELRISLRRLRDCGGILIEEGPEDKFFEDLIRLLNHAESTELQSTQRLLERLGDELRNEQPTEGLERAVSYCLGQLDMLLKLAKVLQEKLHVIEAKIKRGSLEHRLLGEMNYRRWHTVPSLARATTETRLHIAEALSVLEVAGCAVSEGHRWRSTDAGTYHLEYLSNHPAHV